MGATRPVERPWVAIHYHEVQEQGARFGPGSRIVLVLVCEKIRMRSLGKGALAWVWYHGLQTADPIFAVVWSDGCSEGSLSRPYSEAEVYSYGSQWWPCIVLDTGADLLPFYCPALAWQGARPWYCHRSRLWIVSVADHGRRLNTETSTTRASRDTASVSHYGDEDTSTMCASSNDTSSNASSCEDEELSSSASTHGAEEDSEFWISNNDARSASSDQAVEDLAGDKWVLVD